MARLERTHAVEGLERGRQLERASEKMADWTNRESDLLNRILEAELAGLVWYTHYSFLEFGRNRIPIVSWMHDNAGVAGPRGEGARSRAAPCAERRSVIIEEYAGQMVHAEELHVGEVDEMLYKPGYGDEQ